MFLYILILLLIGIVSLGSFFYFNHGMLVNFIDIGFRQYNNVPINMIVLYSFLAGTFYALLFFIGQEIRLRTRISRIKRINARLTEELDSLRTAPLEEIIIKEEKDGS